MTAKPFVRQLRRVRKMCLSLPGATEKLSDVTDRLRADLEYLSGWHIGRDIAITLRTLGVLVHAKAF